nr:FAD-dependent oxidoreductase [Streptomyces sp. KM273126]
MADTSAVPGVEDHAYTLSSAQDAELLADRLGRLGTGTVVVGGSGLTGIESAAEIAERHPELNVVLLGRAEPGAAMNPKAKAYVHAALDRLGVKVRAGVEVVKVRPDAVELAGGESIAADAIGDAAAIRQGYGVMHGTCQGGMPTGVHAALSIDRVLRGKQPKRFRFGYYYAPVSLGRGDAVVQFTQTH